MSTNEIVRTFRAKRAGKGKWRAVCPIHGGKHSGPLSLIEHKDGMGIKCFGGCDTKDVLDKVGLTVSDLFHEKREMTPQIQERLTLEDKREALERQLGLTMLLGAIEKPEYWAGARRRIRGELTAIRCKLEPQAIYQEYRERQFQRRVKTVGWERLWQEV